MQDYFKYSRLTYSKFIYIYGMPLKPSPFLVCIFILFSIQTTAQVLNMDRITAPADSLRKWKVIVMAGTNFSSQNDIFDLNARVDITRFLKRKHVLMGVFTNSFTSIEGKNVQNFGYFHLRYRNNDSKKISAEYFLQSQWDDLRGMINRYLAGANLRIRIMDTKTLDIYTGIGLMYEQEKWNYDGVASNKIPLFHPAFIYTNEIKINQYLKISAKLFKTTDLTFTNFIQTRPDKNFTSPRIADFLQWNIPVSKRFSINFNFDSIYDAAPVVPIRYFYYNYSTGFTLFI